MRPRNDSEPDELPRTICPTAQDGLCTMRQLGAFRDATDAADDDDSVWGIDYEDCG